MSKWTMNYWNINTLCAVIGQGGLHQFPEPLLHWHWSRNEGNLQLPPHLESVWEVFPRWHGSCCQCSTRPTPFWQVRKWCLVSLFILLPAFINTLISYCILWYRKHIQFGEFLSGKNIWKMQPTLDSSSFHQPSS